MCTTIQFFGLLYKKSSRIGDSIMRQHILTSYKSHFLRRDIYSTEFHFFLCKLFIIRAASIIISLMCGTDEIL
jgi:hypothetical protein